MGLALINFSLDELLNPRLRVYRAARRGGSGQAEPGIARRAHGTGQARPVASGHEVVLRAEHVCVEYAGPRPTRAVRDVSFELRRGEVLGIAGESGCGKSTLAYALARMLQAARAS